MTPCRIISRPQPRKRYRVIEWHVGTFPVLVVVEDKPPRNNVKNALNDGDNAGMTALRSIKHGKIDN